MTNLTRVPDTTFVPAGGIHLRNPPEVYALHLSEQCVEGEALSVEREHRRLVPEADHVGNRDEIARRLGRTRVNELDAEHELGLALGPRGRHLPAVRPGRCWEHQRAQVVGGHPVTTGL
jgi:hypothetical protein